MGDPHGMEPVEFDFGAASRLKTQCEHTASQIDAQTGTRASYVSTAMTDFEGFYSTVFRDNANTAKSDATQLVEALRAAGTYLGQLATAAEQENARRKRARDWQEEHDNRNLWDKGVDFFSGGDDAPHETPVDPPNHPPIEAPVATRKPLTGTGGGGTSSARPDDLTSFADGSSTTNSVLDGRSSTLQSLQSEFTSNTSWGTFDATSAITGLAKWQTQNHNDVKWAKTVAAAFTAAGGSGDVSSLPNSSIHSALQSAGVNESRQDLSIAMPTAIGHPPTSGYSDDPVNTATGNFVETESDLEFPESANALFWRRSYNSLNSGAGSTVSGAFGPGWSTWCEAGLALSDEAAVFTMPDGRQITFPRLGEAWDRASGESMWLTREGDDLVVSDNAGSRWSHALGGRLVRMVAGEGDEVTLEWDGDRLLGLHHSRGRSVRLEWNGEQVSAVRASDGRTVSYDYDASGRLVAADGLAGVRRYGWDDAGLIASVSDADGVVEVENTYDERGRVATQRSPHGRVSHYSYLPDLITVVADEDGTRANTWISDDKGRLVGVIDSHDNRQSTAYDADGNVVMVTARDGGVTVRDYDDRGRQTREVRPSGADVAYAYDALDRVTSVEVVGGEQPAVSTLAYEGDDRSPSTLTDAEGGVTRLEWADGLLQRMTDPTGVSIGFEYDAHGDLSAMTDALGRSSRFERDEQGRVVAAVRPGGARTTFTYDAGDLPTTRTDPDGGVWRFENTRAGRRHAVVDPLGARTEVEHDAAGEDSATVDPLGRAVHRTFDDLGRLASVRLPDGSSWELTHDAMGRLTEVTDPLGGVSHRAYDVVGEPTAVTDPTGVRQELASTTSPTGTSMDLVAGEDHVHMDVDRLGRLVSQTSPDGGVRLIRYDLCGRPVEVVDPLGGVTRLVRDAAGRVTTVVAPSGAETGYTYDQAGHLETVTDPTGATTRFVRDADNRVVEEHLPTGEVATTRYDAMGRILARREPGVGTTTCAYDGVGRLVEQRDPRSGHRVFAYDDAGQLVSATDGNGATSTYTYDVNGRVTAILSPDGGLRRREYDVLGHVVAEVDPLGRRTTAEYDAAGRQVSQTDPLGSRIAWHYGEDGLLSSVSIDGVEHSRIERDLRRRQVRVTDRSGPDGAVVVHELTWDAQGRMVSRTRDGRGTSWAYDADGNRIAMTMPDGSRVDYARDPSGRVVGVTHPLLGTVVAERDESGRVVSATAGGSTQRWVWSDGFLSEHHLDGRSTRVEHDESGRISAVTDEAGTTSYSFDEACQLVGAATRNADGEQVVRWRYDRAGRMVAESFSGPAAQVSRELTYDVAGQLTSIAVDVEDVTTYSYDGAGRRTREQYADGSARELAWRTDGWLSAITLTDRLGDTHRTDVVVDALGELARISGPDGLTGEVFLDSADPWKAVLGVGDAQVVGAVGFTGATGAGREGWAPNGWRTHRATDSDPWRLAGSRAAASYAASLAPTGELSLGDLEWMGVRLYDPATRAFLSVDPIDPLVGAGWAGNPYSFAGNDPLHALDPLGLHPLTDAELDEYNSSNGFGGWVTKGWGAWVVGGLLVVGGGIAMATGFGGPLGMAMVSAGADTLIQKATTGTVDYRQVAVSAVVGGVTAGAGSMITLGAKEGAWTLGREVGTRVVTNAVVGSAGGAGHYLAGNWGHVKPGELLGSTLAGGIGGVAGGASDGAGSAVATRLLGQGESGAARAAITHGTAAVIDTAGGTAASAADQYASTGHVNVHQALATGGGAGLAGRAGAGAEHVAPARMPANGDVGTVMNVHHGASGAGSVVQMVTDEGAKHVP